jgi:hypothetical protein
MDVAFFRSDVEPLGLERQVEADDPKLEGTEAREKGNYQFGTFQRTNMRIGFGSKHNNDPVQ